MGNGMKPSLRPPAWTPVQNTLGVRCEARRLGFVRSERELSEALSRWPNALVLGQRSNLVLPRRLERPVLVAAWRGLQLVWEGDDALLTAAAGESWHALVRYSLGQGLGGLENLALIPGSVGAAPIQNIGAYGVELAERLTEVRVLDRRDGRVRSLAPSACGFGYRTSLFKAQPELYVVLGLTLRLGPCNPLVLEYPDIRRELARLGQSEPSRRQVAEAVIRIRRRKLPDPRFWGNVGSFFKNPLVSKDAAARLAQSHPGLATHSVLGGVKLSAAQLIDRCGWKGRRLGKVGVWPRQPLVLVNHGGGAGEDFLALGERIRQSVKERFGLWLELEPAAVKPHPP